MRILQHWQAITIVTVAVIFASFPYLKSSFSQTEILQTGWIQEADTFQKNVIATTAPAPSLTPQPTTTPLKVLVAGDLMFDRHIRQHAVQNGNDFIFQPIADFLKAADYVVVNLEGPITSFNSKSVGSVVGSPNNYLFTFPDTLPETLVNHHITLVSLGNNHILNFGQAGLEQTLKHLNTHQISYFGHVSETDQLVPISITRTEKNISIGWINYNQFSAQPRQSVITEIARLRSTVDYVVVYTHWDNEYQPKPAVPTVAHARAMIDAGADLVIGSHPHVIQVSEEYQGKKIYYSLGNFIFDQYFEPAVKKGMVLELLFTPNSNEIVIKEHYVELLPTGQTHLLDSIE